MISGVFSFSALSAKDLETLVQETGFEDAIQEEINFNSCSFITFRHVNLPKTDSGSYFIDENQQSILIQIGTLYGNSKIPLSQFHNSLKKVDFTLFEHLNGDFAFIFIDFESKTSFFIKNQLGTVPLTIAEKNGCYYFSSDAMGLSKALFGAIAPDTNFVKSRFYDYQGYYDVMPHDAVQKVLPGHYISITENEIQSRKYWFPENVTITSNNSRDESIAELKKLTTDAVEVRSNAGFTSGAHISGGLDSTYISVLAKKFSGQKTFNVFSWSPSDISHLPPLKFDERTNIEKQAKQSGFSVHYTNISPSDYIEFTKEWRAPSEAVYEKTVIKNAQKLGVNLIFSGWGGDEFIGLRDEALYYETFKRFQFKGFWSLNRRIGTKSKVAHLVNNAILPLRHKPYFKYKMHPDVHQYLDHSVDNQIEGFTKSWYTTKKGYQLGLIEYYHLAQRAEDWYVSGQRSGVEYRFPLLDIRTVEYCLSLEGALFIGTEIDRPLMRSIVKEDVIEEIYALNKQSDPAAMKSGATVQKEAIEGYLNRFDELKQNEYLSFVKLDLLLEDLKKNKHYAYYTFHTVLSIHEFMKNYSK